MASVGKGVEFKEKGNTLMAKKDWEGAIESYTKAIGEDASNHLFYSNRCAAYSKNNQKDLALADAEKCVELAPEWPKSYVRLGQALHAVERYAEAVEAVEKGLTLDKDNGALVAQRALSKTQNLVGQLKGKWHGSVPEEMGGYDQEIEFVNATTVNVKVFEKSVTTKMVLDAGPEPAHMDLCIPDQAKEQTIYYICKIQDDVLHLCSPSFEKPNERPKRFEGPSYVTLKRGAIGSAVDDETIAKIAKMSVEEKIINYIKDALKIFPGKRLLPLQTDSEQQQNEITLLNIKFQSENYKITSKYGADVETIIREYLLKEKTPTSAAVTEQVEKLKSKMQEAYLLPPDAEIEQFSKQHKAMEKENQAAPEPQKTQTKPAPTTEKKQDKSSTTETKKSKAPPKDPFPMIALGAVIIGGLVIAGILLSRKK